MLDTRKLRENVVGIALAEEKVNTNKKFEQLYKQMDLLYKGLDALHEEINLTKETVKVLSEAMSSLSKPKKEKVEVKK